MYISTFLPSSFYKRIKTEIIWVALYVRPKKYPVLDEWLARGWGNSPCLRTKETTLWQRQSRTMESMNGDTYKFSVSIIFELRQSSAQLLFHWLVGWEPNNVVNSSEPCSVTYCTLNDSACQCDLGKMREFSASWKLFASTKKKD